MQEATRRQNESNQQLRQEWGLPTWEQEFPVSQLELVLQKLVWPAPQQESRVPEPEPEVQALEPELPAPERKPAVQELQLPEEEELKCPAPPQPRPPPQQSSPALVGTVPCPVLVDTLPECMDLPVLDLVPRSGHHQAQLLTWSLAPLPLKPQTSRRGRVTSLAFPLPPAVFPLESQRSLRQSRGSHLCLSLHRPGYRPKRRSPLASRLGPPSPDRGPYPEAPEESTHPQAHPKDWEKMGLCGLEDPSHVYKDSHPFEQQLQKLTTTTPALTQEGEDEHTLSSEACAIKLTAFFHTADSPCSHPRATASEDNAALGQLQASPQAPGQTTGVAGARRRCAGPQPHTSACHSLLPVTGLRSSRPGQAVRVPPRRFSVPSRKRRRDQPTLKPARGRGRRLKKSDLRGQRTRVGANILHVVSESVGAPTTLEMETIEELIAMIKRNTAAQQEQNKKWRVELGLPEPEPTDLDRLLQKWKVELPSREPEEEELPLPEPRGEELPLPEPYVVCYMYYCSGAQSVGYVAQVM
ncbi:UNVERIFIED_CONTAM: hypothetical protein FKN15_028003 [Acipenser sinensis]